METLLKKKRKNTVSVKQYNEVCKDKFNELKEHLANTATKDDQVEIKDKVGKMYKIMFEGNGIPALAQVAKDFKVIQKEHHDCQKIVSLAKAHLDCDTENKKTIGSKAADLIYDLVKIAIIGLIVFFVVNHDKVPT